MTDGGGGYQRIRHKFLLSLGRQHLCTVPIAGALIQQGWRERCVCPLHPSQPLHCPAGLGICPGDALAQVALVPSFTLCTGHVIPCARPKAHPPLDAAGMACKHFSPKQSQNLVGKMQRGWSNTSQNTLGQSRESQPSPMVGNPCHRPVVLADTSPQFPLWRSVSLHHLFLPNHIAMYPITLFKNHFSL